jgi:methylmalonyl-CoA/ethylmalonyl-CoA epimerase
MRLQQVAQHADDLDRAAAFYAEHFGARVLARFDPPGLVFLDADGVRLMLSAESASALLYVAVADVRREVERLRAAGVTVESEPRVIHVDEDGRFGPPGWEEWMAFVRDSEGNLVGLSSRGPSL